MERGNVFDDERIDLMMEQYKEEILKLQRAKKPVREENVIISSSIPYEEEKPKESIKEERKEKNLIINGENSFDDYFKKAVILKGLFIYENKSFEAFLKFSSFGKEVSFDVQRGVKKADLKIIAEGEEINLQFRTIPVLPFDSLLKRNKFYNAFKRDEITGLLSYARLWEYLNEYEDFADYFIYYLSDMGTPSSFYGTRYYSEKLVYKENDKKSAVRFILTPKDEKRPFSNYQSQEAMSEGDFLLKDCLNYLKNNSAEFSFEVQKISFDDFKLYDFDVFNEENNWSLKKISPYFAGKLIFDSFIPFKDSIDFNFANVGKNLYFPYTLYNREIIGNEDMLFPYEKGENNAFKNAGERLKFLDERSEKRLLENMAFYMKNLNGKELEEALLFMTRLNFSFGKNLMNTVEA